jgi:hypothetical protein
MPLAAITGIAGGLAGAGQSAASGKKASDALNKQVQIQQQQLQLGRELTGAGMGAWKPAENYWQTLLSGTPAAVQDAIGPISEQMRGQGQAGINQIASSMPAGGERNLAISQAQQQQYGNLARLYAGVQPQAASALGQLSSIPMNVGVGVMSQGAPQVGAGLWSQAMGQQQAAQGMAGAGQMLYKGINGLQNNMNAKPGPSINSSQIPQGGYGGLGTIFAPTGVMAPTNVGTGGGFGIPGL